MNLEQIQNKYDLTTQHPDLLAIEELLPKNGLAFDAGCNKGRNSVYLQSLGMQVYAVDIKPESVEFLNTIIKDENLRHIKAEVADLSKLQLNTYFDFINCTMVLQMLDKPGVYTAIENFQKHTKKGGLNLIIAPIITPNPKKTFNFSFQAGELKNLYSDWELIKYEEDWGKLGKRDENGERIQLLFVTIVARKI